MSFSAASLIGDLGLNIDPFTKGMLGAQSIAGTFPHIVASFLADPLLGWMDLAKTVADGVGSVISGSISGIGAGISGAFDYIKSSFYEVADSAHQLGIEASKAGVSASFLNKVGAAAQEVNLPLGEVAHAMAFLSGKAAEVAQGNDEMAETFGKLGISVFDVSGHMKGTKTLFSEVANAIKSIHDPAMQARAAEDLLSRGGIEMLPLLKQGMSGIDAAAERIKAAGGGIDESLIGMSDQAVQLRTIWNAAWQGIQQATAKPFLKFASEHAQDFAGIMNRAAAAVRVGLGYAFSWIDTHSAQIGTAMVTAGNYAVQGLNIVSAAVKVAVGWVESTGLPAVKTAINWLREEGAVVMGQTLPAAIAKVKPYADEAVAIFWDWWDIGKKVSAWAIDEAAPAIGKFLTGAYHDLEPAIEKGGDLLQTYLGYLHETYVWVNDNIIPALHTFGDLARPVAAMWLDELKALGKALEWIFDKIDAVMKAARDALHLHNSANHSSVGSLSGPPAPSGVATGLSAGGGLLQQSGALSNASQQAVQIANAAPQSRRSQPQPIKVTNNFVPLSANQASSQIAQAIRPGISEAFRRQAAEMAQAADSGIGDAL